MQLQYYQLEEKLGESLQAAAYKAFHKNRPQQPLTLKILKFLSGSEDQARYLHQKVERLKVLHDARACIPMALESDGELQFIVQPWFAGITLDRWQDTQPKNDLTAFFTLACTLADTLQAVHDAGIVHGGIKPHNVLIQPGTLSLRLTDFITPLDIRDVSHFIYDASFVRDTLAYTSPEQTGRINHRVDFSTDLYSLGIVLYELLTGELPFFSDDPLELIHSHLAEEAPTVNEINPFIPQQLGDIIAKLTLKEPEKRYQSGNGLLADLIRCRDEYAASGTITPFHPGLHDRTKRVVFISKMVGREQEARTILDEYEQVTQGSFRSVFISGLSGIGKTRLIQELQKPLVKNRGYFTSGKFDQYQKNIPYSSLIQALRHLMRTFLTESDAQVAQWKRKILAAVEANGRVITDVVPELEFIIGPQPEVAHLPPVEARNRFNNLFGRFLASLASEENPLILFIDDLQWCDVATFGFLQYVFANCEDYPWLYFMGAYRHNEVDTGHSLSKLLSSIQDREGPMQGIRITELDELHSHEMVAYILDASLEDTATLAHFIAGLTEGNPLFVSESLAYLYNENLLFMDEGHQWHWDINRIRDSHMPATVVELFSSKVRKLPDGTLRILEHCACMGNRFTALEVALILGTDLQKLFEMLKPVLSLGLMLENKADLQFVHDRVQEAVLRTIPARRRKTIHWRIGNRLFNAIPADAELEKCDNLFTIASHLNQGRPANPSAAIAWRLAQINYHAGNKALDALATEAANEFFRVAHELLPAESWQQDYTSTYHIFQKLAKTELMCGRYDASETLINQLVERAQNDLDKAEALAEQTTSLSSIGNFIQAIATANRGLAYFNKAIPEGSADAQERMEALMRVIESKGDVWSTILNMPFTSERKSKIELAFYSELIPDLYMSGLVPQLYLSAAQSTLHCLEGGMDESVIYSFSIMGLNLGEQEQFEQAFRYEDLAHDLCAKYPNTFGATRGMNGIVWCNMHSRSHPSAIVEYSLKGIQCGKNCGDLYNAGLSYGPLMWNLAIQGKNLRRVEEYAEECLHFSRKNQLAFSVGLAEAVMAGWVVPMKRDFVPQPMEDKLARWAADNHVASAGSYFVLFGIASHYLGDYEQADACLQKVNQYLTGLTDNVLKRQWYVFRIINTLRLQEQRHGLPISAAVWEELEPLLAKVRTWSSLGPLLQPYLAFARAEWVRAKGDQREARNLFLDAIESASTQNYTLLEAHLYQCLGELQEQAQPRISAHYFDTSRRLYQACQAERKEALLLERHPTHFPEEVAASEESQAEILATGTLPDLDINYLMKSALAISAEIDLEQLLHKIMNVVLECSGAQHGYLLAKEGDEIVALAESHAVGKRIVYTERKNLADSSACRAIVNYVFRTREKVILDNACAAGPFMDNPEVQTKHLRSILCLPVIKQGELIGVLYLENLLAEAVFTPGKSGMTELLTSHAAISLENARLLQRTRRAEEQIRRLNEELEQRVAERTEELEAANQELESFSYSVAHDLRAPLRSINGFSELLIGKYANAIDATGQDYLDRVIRASMRMGLLIDDLLRLSRLMRVDMKRETVDLSGMAADILQELRKRQPEQRMAVSIETGIVACTDPGMVRLILENLLTNAWKFSQYANPGRIEFGCHEGSDHRIEYFVRDNGVGFNMEYVNKLFTPFQRLHSDKAFEGTGIGLAIVKRAVSRHGGKVWAMSAVNQGAMFCFTLE